MKQVTHSQIVSLFHTYKSREYLPLIAEKFPGVSLMALGSICAQEYQKKMRKTHHLHYNIEMMEYYYGRYTQGKRRGEQHTLLKLSDEIDLSPALLARIIVERYYSNKKCDGEPPPKSLVSQMLKEPCLIDDGVLANEVQECVVSDDHYGCLVDSIKHSIGHEYECKLVKKCNELGLSYIEEDEMRHRGYDKTPDIKLEIPIAVNGRVVNWIESKASFGDEFSHKAYLKDQFWSYWNRFGPGMVIYWFGFIDELDVNQDKGIMLRDDFPEEIVQMNPLMR